MAVTPSTMLELGTDLPEFALVDVTTGATISSRNLRGDIAVIAFICNHCPFVKHIRGGLAEFGRYCRDHGVKLVAISSNDATSHPEDGPGPMADEARAHGFVFPYLHDEGQEAAKAFRAACTPEFYVFDRNGKLAYRGQFDDSRPKNDKPVTGADVRAAVAALLAGHAPSPDQNPSIGCNIKWKRGNEPDYVAT